MVYLRSTWSQPFDIYLVRGNHIYNETRSVRKMLGSFRFLSMTLLYEVSSYTKGNKAAIRPAWLIPIKMSIVCQIHVLTK